MKSILVTGGAGFVGSNLCKYLLQKYADYRLIVLDNLTYAGNIDAVGSGHLGEDADRVRFWYGNVTNGELVGTLEPVDKVARDTDRDFIMSAAEAQVYGIIDEVITTRELAVVPQAAGVA